MRIERFRADADRAALVARIRSLVPAAASVTEDVRAIVAAVEARGDDAVVEYTARFDTPDPPSLRVTADELAQARAALPVEVGQALETAIANIAEVAHAGVDEDRDVTLAEGQLVTLREVPVRRAAVYVPGGRAPYPSTVAMGVVTARAAGVDEVVIATPPPVSPLLLGACALCGADEVYRMGGAQAIAALACGTESVPRVDVIVGPGNLYVQEAKRLLTDRVGVDGFAGPSDVLAIIDADDEGSIRLVALDLLAQAEHGPATLVVAVSADLAILDRLAAALEQFGDLRPTAGEATCVLVEVASLEDALAFSDLFAPEHLELVGPGSEALAPRVRAAGCVFVGWPSATAFGDYVAGSNHVLPTAGAARFSSGLSTRHFRRRMAEVRIPSASLAKLAEAGARIADAEGFAIHAESMTARVPRLSDNSEP